MKPEAPSPRRSIRCSSFQSMADGSESSAGAGAHGLPAKASQARRGRLSNHEGRTSNSFAARRIISRFSQCAIEAGSVRRRLPESMSFCSLVHRPKDEGRTSIRLSVRISHRSVEGRALSATVSMAFALKPTMLNCGHAPMTSGRCVKRFSEQNRMRSFCSRAKSSGSDWRRLPVRLSTSRVSARSKTSGGTSSSPHDRSRRRVPASLPARSWESVSMN
jgi:hypothetical protein